MVNGSTVVLSEGLLNEVFNVSGKLHALPRCQLFVGNKPDVDDSLVTKTFSSLTNFVIHLFCLSLSGKVNKLK